MRATKIMKERVLPTLKERFREIYFLIGALLLALGAVNVSFTVFGYEYGRFTLSGFGWFFIFLSLRYVFKEMWGPISSYPRRIVKMRRLSFALLLSSIIGIFVVLIANEVALTLVSSIDTAIDVSDWMLAFYNLFILFGILGVGIMLIAQWWSSKDAPKKDTPPQTPPLAREVQTQVAPQYQAPMAPPYPAYSPPGYPPMYPQPPQKQ